MIVWGSMSGLYGECIKTSQPNSRNFCRVIKDVCGRALSWKTTPLLLINSGRFPSIACCNLCSCSQSSKLIVWLDDNSSYWTIPFQSHHTQHHLLPRQSRFCDCLCLLSFLYPRSFSSWIVVGDPFFNTSYHSLQKWLNFIP